MLPLFGLRALCLLGRKSTTYATPPAAKLLFLYFVENKEGQHYIK
jgi:hypothetical protein